MPDVLPMARWLALAQGELELPVTRKVSMARVVNVFCHAEHEWVVELIQLAGAELHVVLHAISVGVSDPSSPGLFGLANLKEVEVLGALDHADVVRKPARAGGSGLKVLGVGDALGVGDGTGLVVQVLGVHLYVGRSGYVWSNRLGCGIRD